MGIEERNWAERNGWVLRHNWLHLPIVKRLLDSNMNHSRMAINNNEIASLGLRM